MKSLLAAFACVFALMLVAGPAPLRAAQATNLDSDKGGVTLKDNEIKDGKDKDERSKTKPPKDSDEDHDHGLRDPPRQVLQHYEVVQRCGCMLASGSWVPTLTFFLIAEIW